MATSPASVLFNVGDSLPGLPDPVSDIDWAVTNNVGGWVFGFKTDPVGVPVQSGLFGTATGASPSVLRIEGTVGGFEQFQFENRKGFFDDGRIVYSAQGNGPGGPIADDDAIFLDDTILALESEPVPGLPGAFFDFPLNSSGAASSAGLPVFLAEFREGANAGDRVGNAFYIGTDRVLETGDDVGVTDLVGIGSTTFDSDYGVSADGSNYAVIVNVGDDFTNNATVVVNGTAVDFEGIPARETFAIPASAGGLPGEIWDNFDNAKINGSGRYYFTGDTDGDTATDEFVATNEGIFLREGDTIPSADGDRVLTGLIEGLAMNEQGDWAVMWDVAADEVDAPPLEALIVNGVGVLFENDLIDFNGDGVIDAADGGRQLDDLVVSSMGLTPRTDGTIDIYFEAVSDLGVDGEDRVIGAFTMNVAIPEPASAGVLALAGLTLLRRRR
jgi:hypothetical protein